MPTPSDSPLVNQRRTCVFNLTIDLDPLFCGRCTVGYITRAGAPAGPSSHTSPPLLVLDAAADPPTDPPHALQHPPHSIYRSVWEGMAHTGPRRTAYGHQRTFGAISWGLAAIACGAREGVLSPPHRPGTGGVGPRPAANHERSGILDEFS